MAENFLGFFCFFLGFGLFLSWVWKGGGQWGWEMRFSSRPLCHVPRHLWWGGWKSRFWGIFWAFLGIFDFFGQKKSHFWRKMGFLKKKSKIPHFSHLENQFLGGCVKEFFWVVFILVVVLALNIQKVVWLYIYRIIFNYKIC